VLLIVHGLYAFEAVFGVARGEKGLQARLGAIRIRHRLVPAPPFPTCYPKEGTKIVRHLRSYRPTSSRETLLERTSENPYTRTSENASSTHSSGE
jgi:hypothetical protein